MLLLWISVVLIVTAGIIGLLSIRQENSGNLPNQNVNASPSPSPSPTPEKPIRVFLPQPNDEISSPVSVKGEARGFWYFEASFPIRVVDATGKVLGTGIAQAQGEWMTTEFVPFALDIPFETPETPTGEIIFEKDNPSGLPENADEWRVPVRFSIPQAVAKDGCVITGCSSHVCSNREVETTCIYNPEYECYKTAECKRQQDNRCGWTQTSELLNCISQTNVSTNP